MFILTCSLRVTGHSCNYYSIDDRCQQSNLYSCIHTDTDTKIKQLKQLYMNHSLQIHIPDNLTLFSALYNLYFFTSFWFWFITRYITCVGDFQSLYPYSLTSLSTDCKWWYYNTQHSNIAQISINSVQLIESIEIYSLRSLHLRVLSAWMWQSWNMAHNSNNAQWSENVI